MFSDTGLVFLSSMLVLAGLAGAVLPFLPGPPLSFFGIFLYAWATNFSKVTPLALGIFFVLTILTVVLDIFAPAMFAKGRRASRSGVIGAILGAFLGIAIMGPAGIILGPFLGGFGGEYWAARSAQKALRVAWGAFLGTLAGTAFKLAVTLAMAGYFVYVLIS